MLKKSCFKCVQSKVLCVNSKYLCFLYQIPEEGASKSKDRARERGVKGGGVNVVQMRFTNIYLVKTLGRVRERMEGGQSAL